MQKRRRGHVNCAAIGKKDNTDASSKASELDVTMKEDDRRIEKSHRELSAGKLSANRKDDDANNKELD